MDLSVVDQALDYLPPDPWIRGLTLIAASVVLAKLTDWIISAILIRWTRRTKSDLDDKIVEAIHRPIFWSVLIFGLWLLLLRVDIRPEILLLAQRSLKTIAILLWSVFGWKASRILLTAFSRLEEKNAFIQPKTVPLLDNSLKIVLTMGVIYFLFITWGINLAAWMAGAGIAGIALGFAAKDTLANLFAGISLIIDAPYQNGDFIVIATGQRGRVTKIGLRSTRILTRDDIEITVPNAIIANETVTNETGGPWEKERIRIDVGVAYGSDIDRVKEVLIEIAASHSEVSPDPEPRVRFRALGDSALNLQLLCWIDEPVLRGRAIDGLLTDVYKRFAEEGIEIPFPQRDVHLRGGDSPLADPATATPA